MLQQHYSQSSAPQLFLFFGCGALTILVAGLSAANNIFFSAMDFLASAGASSASFGIILSPIIVFLCYVLGATVMTLGFMAVVVAHSKWVTKLLNIEVDAIRSDNKAIQAWLAEAKASLVPLYTGIGFGLFQVTFQIGIWWTLDSSVSEQLILIFAGISFLCYFALRWRFHILIQFFQKLRH